MRTKRAIQIADLAATKSISNATPEWSKRSNLRAFALALTVPMLKDDRVDRRDCNPPSRSASRSPGSRSSCLRTSRRKPSSPSRMRGCSTNYAAHWSSRRQRRRCFKLSAALLAILSQCLRPCWRMPCASAMPHSATSTAGTATVCILLRRTTRRLPSRRLAGLAILRPGPENPVASNDDDKDRCSHRRRCSDCRLTLTTRTGCRRSRRTWRCSDS